MDTPVAGLFREHPDFDQFKASVIALGGDFPFERDDMLLIGEAYFERYPDCFSNRSCQEVALGYRLVRICVIEKMAAAAPPGLVSAVRDMLNSVAAVRQAAESLVQSSGAAETGRIIAKMESVLKDIQDTIDSLPTGMIKERFIGGVSYIHNIVYLIKAAVSPMLS